MQKRHILIFFCLILCFLGAGCRNSDASWRRVQSAGVLRVGLDPTYPPFEVADENGVYGLDVDLAKALASELGIEVSFVYFGYDGLYDALTTKQVDVLISAMVIVPQRTRDFAYSQPYYDAGQILIVPQDRQDIETMADIEDGVLAVELGAQGHVEATTWARRLPDLTVQPFNTADDALAAVLQQQAEAALVDSISGRLFLINAPDLRRVEPPITSEPYAFVVRAKDEALLDILNETLEVLQQSGQLEEIIQQWLH